MILRYDAYDPPDNRHPQIVMRELSEKLGFRIIDAIPFSMGDCWTFEVEGLQDLSLLPKFLEVAGDALASEHRRISAAAPKTSRWPGWPEA